jgi:DNA-binding NarL/FixJ family response regulator
MEPEVERPQPIRVLIADDHPGVRAGLRALLFAEPGLIVVGEAQDGEETVHLIQERRPDIVLLDIEMPGLRGDHVMRWIRESLPEIRVLTVSSHVDGEYIRSMLENGASGYITKDEAPSVLVQAIYSIMEEGVSWFSPTVLKSREDRFIEEQTLTEREVRILQQLLIGRRQSEIAEYMGMDEKRIGDYLELLMRKFRAPSLEALKEIARRVLSARDH